MFGTDVWIWEAARHSLPVRVSGHMDEQERKEVAPSHYDPRSRPLRALLPLDGYAE